MRIVIIGSRPDGHARVVAELFGAALDVVGLVDDFPENAGREISGFKVLGRMADLARLRDEGVEGAALGFGVGRGRADVLAGIVAAGLALPTLVHPTAVVADSAVLGDGCQILQSVNVGPGTRVGRGALINTGAILSHDIVVADAGVVSPGAVLSGRCVVGAEAEIGSGAVLIPDIRVGARAIVGAGAVVIRDVPDDTTVAGVPARPI